MNSSPVVQITGNVCVALAAFVFLFPLQRVIWEYAAKYLSDDRWVTPVLYSLIPLWLLLMVALLCMTASGGFDSLRLSRPVLYALTVGASGALAVATFVFIGLYIRPGMMPRVIFAPGVYFIPFTTGLLVVLSLNQKFTAAIPIQWLRWPWMIFAALSLVGCVLFFGPRLVTSGLRGLGEFAVSIVPDNSPKHFAKIATLDPKENFGELLDFASQYRSPAVREAATDRLRNRADFIDALADALRSGHPESKLAGSCLDFLPSAKFAPEEKKRLAPAARTALERYIESIPGPNFMPPDRRKQLLRWGRKTFPRIAENFASTNVDFSRIMPAFENALRPIDKL